jgi:hypothetical protein
MDISKMATRKAWGDDDEDDDVTDSPEIIIEKEKPVSESLEHYGPRHRISYVKHPSTYAKTLVDVEGHKLVGEDNVPLNIFSREMKEMLAKGTLLCYHASGRPGHRYFVHTKRQGEFFRLAKKRGYSSNDEPFHVYEDEPGLVLPYEGGCPTSY